MKNKIKKVLTTTLISAVSLTAIGCSTSNSKLAKNIDKSMAEFVSSINKLDYVDTSSSAEVTKENLGKIVETAARPYERNHDNNFLARRNFDSNFLNADVSALDIENTITRPSERSDLFKLYILSDSPFISLTSDDNSASLTIDMKFSTEKIEETSEEIEQKINTLILKRSILMIYVNEIYNGNVNLSNENKIAINAYVNVIKENTSFLNGNRGMVKNQLGLASDLLSSEENDNLINYYIIKSGEALETRANKLDSSISAIDSIIEIVEENLSTSSSYFQSNLSDAYENLISNINDLDATDSDTEITENSSNAEIAQKIASSLDFCCFDSNETIENNSIDDTGFNVESNNEENADINENNDLNNNNTASELNLSTIPETNASISNLKTKETQNQRINTSNSDLKTTKENKRISDSQNQTNNLNQNNISSNNQTNLNQTRTQNNNLNSTQRVSPAQNNNNFTSEQNRTNNQSRSDVHTGYVPSTNTQFNQTNSNLSQTNSRNNTSQTRTNNSNNLTSQAQRNNLNNLTNQTRTENSNSSITTNQNRNNNRISSINQNSNNQNSSTNNLNRNSNNINKNSNEQNQTNRNMNNNIVRTSNGSEEDRNNTQSRNNTSNKYITKSVSNMDSDQKIMRADRTPDKTTKEEFNMSKTGEANVSTNHVSRVPYRSNETSLTK